MEHCYQANKLKPQSIFGFQVLLDSSVENPEIPGLSAVLV